MQPEYVIQDGISVDLGGTKTSAARITESKVVRHVEVETEGAASVERHIEIMSELLAELDLKATDGIAVAVTGRVDSDGHWHALNTDTLTQVQSAPLVAMLREQFQRDVRVFNDATAAAIGEWAVGAGQGCRSVGYITVSTGIGGGFILDDRPLISTSGLAGHVGFTSSRFADTLCGSGRFGTVESVAGGRAIARMAAEHSHVGLDARAVYGLHQAGTAWATALIDVSARAVAELCANLKSTLDPEVIVLGGSIGLADGYLALVERHLQSEPSLFRVPLRRSELGANAALIGSRFA